MSFGTHVSKIVCLPSQKLQTRALSLNPEYNRHLCSTAGPSEEELKAQDIAHNKAAAAEAAKRKEKRKLAQEKKLQQKRQRAEMAKVIQTCCVIISLSLICCYCFLCNLLSKTLFMRGDCHLSMTSRRKMLLVDI